MTEVCWQGLCGAARGLLGPKWAEAFDQFRTARQQVFDDPEVLKLLSLCHMAQNATVGLIESGEPSWCNRHGGQPSQIHDEGSRLTEARGF
jgi:hypothetical protein